MIHWLAYLFDHHLHQYYFQLFIYHDHQQALLHPLLPPELTKDVPLFRKHCKDWNSHLFKFHRVTFVREYLFCIALNVSLDDLTQQDSNCLNHYLDILDFNFWIMILFYVHVDLFIYNNHCCFFVISVLAYAARINYYVHGRSDREIPGVET